ncbi:MAG: lipopolysaccharide transport periplasmic protein LptA, partial [Gammaproteobacteria bacterium]|nr:lipopolysaccharide transport periplasmic protein LptA [Gammaproteobacteria bacterium]
MRSINKLLTTLLPILLLASTPFAAHALKEDVNKPIEVEADSVEIDDGSGKSTYKGNVVLTQGSIRLKADSITVIQHETKSDQIKVVGRPATLTQKSTKGKKEIKGRSLRMEYFIDSDILYLIGNASLVQGKDTFKSDRIAYDRKKSLIKGGTSAKGKRRVRVTIKST